MSRLSRPPSRLSAPPPARAAGGAEAREVARVVEADRDRMRAAAEPLRHLYWSARWRKLRLRILDRDHWTCQRTGVSLKPGRDRPESAVVDHIEPHRGDERLFWDEDNLEAVSKAYHDSQKQKIEKSGRDPRPFHKI